jgi:hypothetical protein
MVWTTKDHLINAAQWAIIYPAFRQTGLYQSLPEPLALAGVSIAYSMATDYISYKLPNVGN